MPGEQMPVPGVDFYQYTESPDLAFASEGIAWLLDIVVQGRVRSMEEHWPDSG
ncbi:hypothetical protein [Paenibacillus agri]|uniref:Uncharacterized protein n=1 Tax=Paenibacillus agri TaxID=2744309 RepID=A0A850EGR4_9BACL|nr:hypothetical protein [Paenibacillus agri]NUU60325.1 hypothetical protein [Paenibacillus agri]